MKGPCVMWAAAGRSSCGPAIAARYASLPPQHTRTPHPLPYVLGVAPIGPAAECMQCSCSLPLRLHTRNTLLLCTGTKQNLLTNTANLPPDNSERPDNSEHGPSNPLSCKQQCIYRHMGAPTHNQHSSLLDDMLCIPKNLLLAATAPQGNTNKREN